MNNHGKVWTVEEKNQLARCFREDLTLEQICETQGRTPYGILSKAVELGFLAQHRWGYYRIEQDPWIMTDQVKLIQDVIKERKDESET